jgi:type I restriction enzyme R subunit
MSETTAAISTNFAFLVPLLPVLDQLAGQAEAYLADDPNTCLIKLRQFAELLAQRVASQAGLYVTTEDRFIDVINRLRDRGLLGPDVSRLFHSIRIAGNDAAHEFTGTHENALQRMKMAHALGVWFVRAFGGQPNFQSPPFILPDSPGQRSAALQARLAELQHELEAARAASSDAQAATAEALLAQAQAEALAETSIKRHEEVLAAARAAEVQFEAERQRMESELAVRQAQAAPRDIPALVSQAQAAEGQLELDEATTRNLIDEQLREAGWQADTAALRYAHGARPKKGQNRAIAEWPTANGPADYVLFAGLSPVAVVEAKRKNRDVASTIEQSKRYSQGYTLSADESSPGGPWGHYRVPFLFSTNGRPFLRQLAEKSGIWFLDARRSTNHPRALEAWYTPEGLVQMLKQDDARADAALKTETFSYLDLRGYQKDAIRAAEAAIADGRRDMLVAMATGTGKTRTCIGLVYRLIKAKRFRRVLFLVDRSALGKQTDDAFKDMRLENLQTFSDIYDVKGLGDVVPDKDTKLHIATVQGMVQRLLYAENEVGPSVDQYDCIVVDECHRGYNLDKELSESELQFRDEADYISKYRRVLDHFDAVRIGLTATPALHTTQIFGEPIYQYSYRQAVIDGYLVDYEPPIRIVTGLAEDGMTWKAGETMEVYKVRQGALDYVHLPDEVTVEVDTFNRLVVTENFNRVVCHELARQIDPALPGKTLIFCATDSHADTVVRLLKQAYDQVHGGIDDDAIVKITGTSDKPLELIRRYKNEQNPSIVVTVDLLTTGVDVPKIANIVFMRRVRSRILYEQMVGRATRLCPEISKEAFRIFDAVDLYAALEPVTTMKPVVTNPSVTFEQLVGELHTVSEADHQQEVYEQLLAKLNRKASKIVDDEHIETLAGMPASDLVRHLRTLGASGAAAWFQDRADLALYLDRARTGDGPKLIISHHEDELRRVERGYGVATRPDDYLESFTAFIRDNMNLIPALAIVTQRPRDLTRQQLKELKLELDKHGYSETALRTAWQEMTNEDIAASIIGFIRQRALGSPLVPYGERVDRAVKRILASKPWTQPQRQWLERIGSQLKQETIVDREAMDRGQFKTMGGFARIDKVFEGNLGQVLVGLQNAIWEDVV